MIEQTELAAVNDLLIAIGDTPVNSLTDPNPDVISARAVLSRITSELLTFGWWFNTEYALELRPDGDNIIKVPSGVLQIDPVYSSKNYVVRGGKLYDITNQTFYITEAVTCKVKFDCDLEDMPHAAFLACVAKAKVTFAADMELDETQLKIINGDLTEAMKLLRKVHIQNSQTNVLDSPRARRVMQRMPRNQRR